MIKENGASRDNVKSKKYINVIIYICIIIAALYAGLKYVLHIDVCFFLMNLFMLKYLPDLGTNAGLGLIFLFGVLTSFHCIGMCGGIAISQCTSYADTENAVHNKKSKLWFVPSMLYNLGRIISYTLVGAIVGGLGHIISFGGVWKGIVPIIGGLFMIIMAVNLLGIYPALRRLNIRMPVFFARKLLGGNNYNPLYVGLLSGLMPCGPLQIIQIYALGTRSVIFGAVSMFVFVIGTVPALFIFGVLNTIISRRHSKIILKMSALLVLILGIFMIGRGLALNGVSLKVPLMSNSEHQIEAKIDNNIQTVETKIQSGTYPPITVKKGIPVRWIIKVDKESLNQCNNAIVIPEFKIEKKLVAGDNLVEFTPDKAGDFIYTCWMGMIKSSITVVDDLKECSEKEGEKLDSTSNQGISSNQDNQCKMGIQDICKNMIIDDNQIASDEEISETREKDIEKQEPVDNGNKTKDVYEYAYEAENIKSENTISDSSANAAITDNTKSNKVNYAAEQEFTGYLQDKHCFGLVNAEKDTTFCLKMSECEASGYGIVMKNQDGKGMFHIFDKKGQELAKNILTSTSKDFGVTISVKGILEGDVINVSTIVEEQ